MKKWFALMLAMLMLFSLVGCAAKEAPAADAPAAEAPAADAPAADAPAEQEKADDAAADAVEEAVDEAASAGNPGPYKFGVMLYADTDESTLMIRGGIEKAAEAAGVELIITANGGDYTKNAALLENLLNQDVDAIIDATWSAEVGLVTSARCKEAGVPLITCDVEYDDYAHLLGANNYSAGGKNGEFAQAWIEENWDGQLDHVVAMYGFASGDGVKMRLQGCVDVLIEADYITEEDVTWFDAADTEVTMSVTRDWLTGNPDAEHVLLLSVNDSGGLGAYNAAATMGREENVIVLSYGANSFALEHLATVEESCWLGTVNFNLEGYGDVAVPSLIEILSAGEDNLPHELNTETFVISRDNISEYFSG